MTNTALVTLFEPLIENLIYEDLKFLDHIPNLSGSITGTGKGASVKFANYTDSTAVGQDQDSSAYTFENLQQTVETYVSKDLVQFRTKPYLIEDQELLKINYDKRGSVLYDMSSKISAQVAKYITTTLATSVDATRKFPTTGAANSAYGPTGTKIKKSLTYDDLVSLKTAMMNDNINEEMFLLISPNMYRDLLSSADFKSYLNFGEKTAIEGEVIKALGFNIIVKPTIATAVSATGVINTINYVPASTDGLVALAWFANSSVFVAQTESKIYYDSANAVKQGDIMSCAKYVVAGNRRSDNKGLYAIYQA